MKMRSWWLAIGVWLAVVLNAGAVRAEYPDRAIRLIVPFAPGGANDSVARLVSNKLGTILGQTVVVENRPGGGTVLGTAAVATASPNGYTLLLISPAHTINPYINKSLPYKTLTDFTPISQITRSAYVLVTSPQSNFRSVKDFGAVAHSSGGQISFGSSGTGSAPHLAGQLFATLLGVKSVHIPYQGGALAMIGVIRGDVDMYFSSVAGARSFIESKQVLALAVSSDKRLRALPDVPTVAEAGINGFSINGWYGVVGPANLPVEVTEKLNKAIEEALNEPELVARLQLEGEEVAASTPEKFATLIREDFEKYRAIVASSGLQPR
jgi:tripartite-type tricarboxylate transporter receptor subunit TctC